MGKATKKEVRKNENSTKRFVAIITFITLLIGIFLYVVSTSFTSPKTENVFPLQATIRFVDGKASPTAIDIQVGGVVTFVNDDMVAHWPASNIHPTHAVFPEFDPKEPIAPEDTWSFTFLKTGEWRFHDHLYPEIVGVIRVHGVTTSTSKDETLTSRDFFDASQLDGVDAVAAARDGEQLEALLTAYGIDAVIQDLQKEIGPTPSFDCHSLMHTVGHAAYNLYGAEALSETSDFCHSGFYHGALERMLSVEGTQDIAATVNRVCKKSVTLFQYAQCLHGVGHGIIAYLDYDLPAALSVCGKLAGDDPQRCYGGIFMENIMQAKGYGAVPGHTTTWVSDDPYFPCNAIDKDIKVQQECYKMQTTWMFTLFDGDMEKVMNACATLSGVSRSSCFKSIGRESAGRDRSGPAIFSICAKAPESADVDICVAGGLHVVVDFAGSQLSNEASIFCASLPNERKETCYRTLAGRLPGLFSTTEQADAVCKTFESSFQYLCQK